MRWLSGEWCGEPFACASSPPRTNAAIQIWLLASRNTRIARPWTSPIAPGRTCNSGACVRFLSSPWANSQGNLRRVAEFGSKQKRRNVCWQFRLFEMKNKEFLSRFSDLVRFYIRPSFAALGSKRSASRIRGAFGARACASCGQTSSWIASVRVQCCLLLLQGSKA